MLHPHTFFKYKDVSLDYGDGNITSYGDGDGDGYGDGALHGNGGGGSAFFKVFPLGGNGYSNFQSTKLYGCQFLILR